MTLKVKLTEEFQEEIEDIVWELDVNYIDAIIEWCVRNKTEVESIGDMIRKTVLLKAKVQSDAEDLNFMPKTARVE